MSKISDILPEDESLEKEGPLLHSISKENAFSVPTDYFDSLPSEILEKCRTEEEPKSWGEGILTNLLGYKWKFLASIGCIVVLCFIISQNNRSVSYEALVKNIPDSLIVNHLDKNIADINVSTLEDLQEIESAPSSVKSTSDSANTDEAVIAYLMNNNVNVSDIVNEP